jgi:nucleotide-binding universal stress UspA family protein
MPPADDPTPVAPILVAPILVATDFSARSDRALWRATLLAKEAGVPLLMVHVIDDDRPSALIESQVAAARTALDGAVQSAREVDGVDARGSLVQGDIVAGLLSAADEGGARLIVLGEHRPQLRDSIFGTTAGRLIGNSTRPVLIVKGLPSPPYERVLAAFDLDEASAQAGRRVQELGLFGRSQLIALHALDAPAESMLKRGMSLPGQIDDYLAGEHADAAGRFRRFLSEIGLGAARAMILPIKGTPARTIVETAAGENVSLIVIGARQRTGLKRWLLGSVAEQVLESAEADVLVIPRQAADA